MYLNLSNNNGNSDVRNRRRLHNVNGNTTRNGDVYFKRSMDRGLTFSSVKNLYNNTGSSFSPHLTASGNNVYLTWTMDDGNKFQGEKFIAKNIGSSLQPQIAVSQDGNLIFGVWKDIAKYDPPENASSPDFDLLFRTSSNHGANFSDRNTIGKNVDPIIRRLPSTWEHLMRASYGATLTGIDSLLRPTFSFKQ